MSEEVKRSNTPMKILVNFCRVLLGLTFMFSGIVKAIDPVGTQIKFSDYLYAFGMGGTVLDSTLLILACLLAGLEILLGAYLATGAFAKGASAVVLAIMLVFTPFTLYLALNNPVEDCGCFGDAVILTNWQTFYKNLFLFTLAVFVFIERRLIIPFVAEKRHWTVTFVVVLISIRFMVANVSWLPVLDFRPYKVGTDLRSELENGYNPAFTDFCLMDDNMDDVTAQVLENPGYTFLLVSPHLEDASDNGQDLIGDLFDYCAHWGYTIVGATASGSDAVRRWTDNAGVEMHFLFSDEIPLQTMVRSNPGLVLIKDGVIVNKWSHEGIPSDEELIAPLDEISVGQIPAPDPMRTPWAVALLFTLPLLLIVMIELVRRLIQ